MTPREHMGAALVAQRMSTFAQVDASRFLDKVAGMQAAREFGAAAGHAFRALELGYDREQAALAEARTMNERRLHWLDRARQHVERIEKLEEAIRQMGYDPDTYIT